MNLLKIRLFQAGIFKQAKFLVSTPQIAQKVLYISEAGVVSQELLPMNTGFISALKKAWLVLHMLKFTVYKDGVPAQDEQVLLISDRSYIPLDPNNVIKSKDRERLTSLTDIARLRHAETRADVDKNKDQRTDLAQTIIYGGFMLLGLLALGTFVLKSCGGAG